MLITRLRHAILSRIPRIRLHHDTVLRLSLLVPLNQAANGRSLRLSHSQAGQYGGLSFVSNFGRQVAERHRPVAHFHKHFGDETSRSE